MKRATRQNYNGGRNRSCLKLLEPLEGGPSLDRYRDASP